ncbi:MAG: class E sortase [Arthrobacter sp.]|uniref:class E sortase n=1 Tax=unclassified Arthrobacter TaxID=235627 RepID=UPI00264D5255|nr:class E sortase [Micrococcaceae bacterium]MDN5905329.1 class E sortase [Micrococcaceae bacterium]
MPAVPESTAPLKPGRRRSRSAAIIGGLGEVLVTLGVIVLLFVAWELWWTNIEADGAQEELTSRTLQEFAGGDANASTGPSQSAEAADADRKKYGTPEKTNLDGEETFGVLYVPRFGKDYARPISEGVGSDVLDHLGIGHYPQTQLPGEQGNFAVAAHRQTHGQVFWDIDKLVDGDQLYVQTRQGYYTYRYRSTEIVDPSDSKVLLPVPHEPGEQAGESLLTMTSCHPPFTTRMRIIAYSELESWRPLDAGPPAVIAEAVGRATGGG